jgi:O-succinylbenzoic acid--CoA ligase
MVPASLPDVNARAHLAGGPGELVALDLPPGEDWLELVGDLWWRGVPFLPLDARMSTRERRALLDRARPTVIVDRLGEVVFPEAPPTENLGAVVATSGSGGTPRLAELSRRAIEEAVTTSAAVLGAGAGVPWISCLTPVHVGGLLVLLRGAILGVPVVVHDGFDAGRVIDSGADGAFAAVVPLMVRRLLAEDRPLRGLILLVGGGRLDPADAEAARSRGARVVTTYGMTETTGGVVYDGRPFEGTQVRIGGDGEIELRGPTVMEGYRNDPAATAAAFTLDGWLRTGDLGEVEDDGRLRLSGRADELIRTGAEKVWPDEVERVLLEHPAVRDVAVAGRSHPEWGHEVIALIVPVRADAPPGLPELRAWALERLAPFKAPRDVVLVPTIPRTPSGKIRRGDLPAR